VRLKGWSINAWDETAICFGFLNGLAACAAKTVGDLFGQDDFEFLLQEVAIGWSTNDAKRAAAAFSPDAVYSEPPDKQLYVGRAALFDFFGGEAGRTEAMAMSWRHISYNPKTQVGAGEFTFTYQDEHAHGMVLIKVEGGLIAHWREYYYESDLGWDDFQGSNKF